MPLTGGLAWHPEVVEWESKLGLWYGIEMHAAGMRICTAGSQGYLELFGLSCRMGWSFRVEKSYEHDSSPPFNVLRRTFLLEELVRHVH